MFRWSCQRAALQSLQAHFAELRRCLGEDTSSPAYVFAEPRVGYRMAKGETPERETE